MSRWILGTVVAVMSAALFTGCCKQGSDSDKGTTDPASATAEDKGGSESAGGALTGDEGVKRLKAKGWEPLTAPVVNDAGPAKTTTFISKDGITINFIEYKEAMVAKMAAEGMKSDMFITALFGNTLVQVVCPSGKPRDKCEKAMTDIKG